MTDLTDSLEKVAGGVKALTVELSAFKDKTDIQSALIAKLFDPKGKLAEFERRYLESIDGISGILGDRVKGIRDLASARFKDIGLNDEQSGQRLGLLDAFLEGRVKGVLVETNKELEKANAEIRKIAETASKTITKAFVDMALKGEFSAKKIGNAFLAAATQALSQQFIEKPLAGFFNSVFGSLFGRMGGGAVHAGVPVLVGERAPEVFVPRVPGRILNSNDSRGALSGGRNVTVHQNITFTTDVANSVRAEILNAAPAIANAATQSVINSLRGIRI